MERLRLVMIRREMGSIPTYSLSDGYRLRYFRGGEERRWADVESAAGEFSTTEAALARFAEEFGSHLEEMERRCLFLENDQQRVIGTATAWYSSDFQGQEYGRLHWVGIHPEYQGRGLSKPLVGAAVLRLAELHPRAYLTTQTTSWKAVRVYLQFGFEPLIEDEEGERGWRVISQLVN